MNKIEELLEKQKEQLNSLDIPDNFEQRLNRKLDKTHRKRFSNNWQVKVAVVCILALLVGWQSDTLAFYGKKLIGYEQIMSGTLKELNELGKGQSIGKSFHFSNGVTLTLDAILVDDNQMLAFMTFTDPSGNADNVHLGPSLVMKSRFNQKIMSWAQGEISEDMTEIKYIVSFDAPSLLENQFRLEYLIGESHNQEKGAIAFKLNRNEAMGHTLKKSLNEQVVIDGNTIHIESILASATTTVINGTIQNSFELARDHFLGERMRPNNFNIELIANGNVIPQIVGGMSTNLDGIKFTHEFDALPRDLNSLQIRILSLNADYDVDEVIQLKKTSNNSVTIKGQQLKIDYVYESNGNTFITITTEDSVVLTRVSLVMDGEKVRLKETTSSEYDKTKKGIFHTRTLRFPGTGEQLSLEVQSITYLKESNETISIPLD